MSMLGDPRDTLAIGGTLRERDTLIREATHAYLDSINPDDYDAISEIGDELMATVNAQIKAENVVRLTLGEKPFRAITKLANSQIGDIILATHNVKRIAGAGLDQDKRFDRLAIYNEYGANAGLYVPDMEQIKKITKEICYTISDRSTNEVISHVYSYAERAEISKDPNKIAVNNGIFDFKSKILNSFDPEQVFTAKIPVDYNPAAEDVEIVNPDGSIWTVESWMASLSDDPDVVQLLWEGVTALIRPNVPWDKALFLINSRGCNGKGTYLAMLRELAGSSASSVSLKTLGQKFGAASIYGKTAILSDENDTAAIVEDAETFKGIITHDIINVEQKHKDSFSYRFPGIAVFCANSLPRFRDDSKSIFRRMLAIPFSANFFENGENKAIKADYIHRKETLEYVLKRALYMNVYEFSEPDICKVKLNDVRTDNDMVMLFLEDVLPHFSWDLLPFSLLYQTYLSYLRANNPSARALGRNKFIDKVVDLLEEKDYGFYCLGKKKPIPVADLMQGPEPIIAAYNVRDWQHPTYTGSDLSRICSPILSSAYRGIVRMVPRGGKTDLNYESFAAARDY